FVMRKMATHGRSGRYFFVGALKKRDVNIDDQGRVYLRGGWAPPQLQYQYFNSYMQRGPCKPHLVRSWPGNAIPMRARRILKYGNVSAMRLTSIPDAQNRKTFIGCPYRKKCHDWIIRLQEVGLDFFRLCYQTSANVPKT